MNTLNRQRGFSLIELMIAAVLGLVMSAGISFVFSGNKQSNDLNTAMSDMQESARFALQRLSADIRMAGFQGCNDINRGGPNILATNAPTSNLERTAVSGYVFGPAGTWLPTGLQPVPTNVADPERMPLEGTHALNLQFGSQATYPLAQLVGNGNTPNKSADILVDATPGVSSEDFNLQVGEFAIISNCTGGDLFEITAISGGNTKTVSHVSGPNTSDNLTYDYIADPSTKFMRFNSNIYYIADSGQENSSGDMIPGLFQQSLPYTSMPTLLVTGVENLRFEFGIRTSSNTIDYFPAGTAGLNTNNIEAVKVGILMVSEERVAAVNDDRSYMLAGQLIGASAGATANYASEHPNDLRYRQAFNTTVKIRNRRGGE